MQGREVEELVTRAAAGDGAAYEALVTAMAPVVWAATRTFRLSSSDANDVAQGVWLHLVEHLAGIREPRKLPGWLATTARNECLALLRRSGRSVPTDFGESASEVESDESTVDSRMLRGERAVALRTAFESLGHACRELLSLLMSDPPLSYAEISETLGMPVASIGPTRGRCLEKLRRHPAIVRIT